MAQSDRVLNPESETGHGWTVMEGVGEPAWERGVETV